jgi:hypothetical protein
MPDHLATLKSAATGLLGAAAGVGGAIVSTLPALETGLRVASAAVGLLAALLALIKVWQDLHRK